MKKYSKFLKIFTIISGIISIISGFMVDANSAGGRILYICLGVILILIATFATLRNTLVSLTFLGASIVGLKSIFTTSGNIDVAGLLTTLTCFGISFYFGSKAISTFSSKGFSRKRGTDLTAMDVISVLRYSRKMYPLRSKAIISRNKKLFPV